MSGRPTLSGTTLFVRDRHQIMALNLGRYAYHVLQTVATPAGSRNLGLDPITHRVLLAAADFGPPPSGSRGRGPVLPGTFKILVVEHQ